MAKKKIDKNLENAGIVINQECEICDYYAKQICKGRLNFKVPCIYATKIVKKV